MANAIDLHVGKRLRRRRRLLGLTQQQLAESIGIRFQQIQKYECGANRVTASRLYELAVALNVPVNYFFEGLQQMNAPANAPGAPANDRDLIAAAPHVLPGKALGRDHAPGLGAPPVRARPERSPGRAFSGHCGRARA